MSSGRTASGWAPSSLAGTWHSHTLSLGHSASAGPSEETGDKTGHSYLLINAGGLLDGYVAKAAAVLVAVHWYDEIAFYSLGKS